MPPHLLIPLGSGLIYAISALYLKRATEGGAGPWRIAFVTNWVQALFFAPMWILGGGAFTWEHLLHAVIAGTAFFIGQVFTFLALSRGDVSVTTPVLGSKVVFVAFLTVFLIGEQIPRAWWGAAALTALATALLGGGRMHVAHRKAAVASVLFAFPASLAFALTDVIQQKWARAWGFGHFAPTMFLVVGLLSCGLIPLFHEPLRALPKQAWRSLIPGSILLSLQAWGIAFSIINFGNATAVNIFYNTRAVWSVVLVWTVGHWFGNLERTQGHHVMLRRLFGAALLLVAIILVLSS